MLTRGYWHPYKCNLIENVQGIWTKIIILHRGPNATINMAVYVLSTMPAPDTALTTNLYWNIDGVVQERRNSSALAMELHPSCTKTSMFLKDSATSLSPLWTGDVIYCGVPDLAKSRVYLSVKQSAMKIRLKDSCECVLFYIELNTNYYERKHEIL